MAMSVDLRPTIFVKNLNFTITKDQLQEICAQFGDIAEVRIPSLKGSTELRKGCAFVAFET